MNPSIGQPLNRVDGRLKVTGAAIYAAEFPLEHAVHAVMVLSTISRGAVARMTTTAAEAAPGVLAVLTPFNAPKLAVPPSQKQNPQDRIVQALQDPKVMYQNQPIALIVADTLERATHAAALVEVHYQVESPTADFDQEKRHPTLPPPIFGEPIDKEQGSLAKGLADAEVQAGGQYTTPFEHHNPMEPHATMAVWEDPEHLTVYDSTQGVFNERKRLAVLFGLPPENVRVICKFLGGGFGCKGSTWSHVLLAILAAKVIQRPVKLVLQRTQMFGPVGGRPRTEQQVRLGARRDGTLTALQHTTLNATSTFDIFTEPSATTARMLYACPNILTQHRLARLSIGTPTFMRAPGESTGNFALETAMDELAVALEMDPVALRLKNYAEQDPDTGRPWSSKSLRECYRVGAESFGWARRTPAPRSMRDGKSLIGWGMATATYPTKRSKAAALARLLADGTASVQSGTQDLGTGAYTVFTQVAADAVGLPPERVRFDLGDTHMPETPVSGGSQTSASVGSAVKRAGEAVRRKAIELAVGDPASPLHGADPAQIQVEDGRLERIGDPSTGETYAALLTRHRLPFIEAHADAEPGPEKKQFSMHAFGASFVEVRVDPDLGEVRVSRMVGAYGVGTVLNAKTARSQLMGGMVWGLGMALLEQSVLDPRSGRFVTQDLADYHLPTNLDVPSCEVHFVAENDPHVNEVGAKGIGEIGITGTVAAIGNAVFHATGRRIRDLPITLDKLL